jgi:predicted thioesterase
MEELHMARDLQIGIEGLAQTVVSELNTAIAHGSGAVSVFATPALVGLMEKAALSSVEPLLEQGTYCASHASIRYCGQNTPVDPFSVIFALVIQ